MLEHAGPGRALWDHTSNLTVTDTHPAAAQPRSQACCASPTREWGRLRELNMERTSLCFCVGVGTSLLLFLLAEDGVGGRSRGSGRVRVTCGNVVETF